MRPYSADQWAPWVGLAPGPSLRFARGSLLSAPQVGELRSRSCIPATTLLRDTLRPRQESWGGPARIRRSVFASFSGFAGALGSGDGVGKRG